MPSRSSIPPLLSSPSNPRKRTTSFSDPLPRKTSRTMLRRTESFLSLSDYNDESHFEGGSFLHMTSSPSAPSRTAPLSHARLHYKEQRERDATKLGRKRPEFTIAPPSSSSATSASKRSSRAAPQSQPQSAVPNVRTTSPLSPKRKMLPPRASFPRSKPEPDLYRVALKGRMRSSPEGEKILRMGPRLAIAILSATRDLERIVSAHEDDDVTMGDDTEPTMRSAAWGLGRDLVAVPCGA